MCEAHTNDANEIFKTLCRSLADDSGVQKVSARFAVLKTNCERLNFAHQLIRERGLLPDFKPDLKSNDLSIQYRKEGNEKFKTKNDEAALELYTKSIAFAEKDSTNLGLAYANRSAVLFEHAFYEECLKDIKRAEENHYPENLKAKLFHRRANAEKLKHQQRILHHHEDIPCLSSEFNPKIACASDQIKIIVNEEMGRHVISTKHINAGDVIAIEKPFAKVLLGSHIYNHCHNCLKLCYDLVPCENCTSALFCNESCKDDASNLYHQYECPIWTTLIQMNVTNLTLLALRVAICAKKEYVNVQNFGSNSNVMYRSNNYQEIHELLPNTDKRSVADLFARAVTSAIVSDLVQNHTSFFEDTNNDNQEMFKEMLLLHAQTGPSNFHEISELVEIDGNCQTEEIGAGAFAFFSLLNHSCSPNVVRHCYGSAIVLRTLRPIEDGQQLFDNYGYHHALMCKKDRQEHLNKQYHFECKCEACIFNWPLYHNLPSIDYDIEIDEDDIKELRNGSVERANRVLKKILKKATDLEASIPCRNLANAQEAMKQCFAIFGNKRYKFYLCSHYLQHQIALTSFPKR